MRIECILKREGGTNVELDGQSYLFAPQPDGRHIADVKNAAHVKRLLGIAEAYQPAELTDPDDDEEGDGDRDGDPIIIETTGNQGAQATGEVPPSPATGDQVTLPTEPPAGATSDDTAPAHATPADTIKAALATAPAPDATPAPNPYEAMTDAEVNAEFEKAFGRPPNSKAKRATIIQKLLEKAAQG